MHYRIVRKIVQTSAAPKTCHDPTNFSLSRLWVYRAVAANASPDLAAVDSFPTPYTPAPGRRDSPRMSLLNEVILVASKEVATVDQLSVLLERLFNLSSGGCSGQAVFGEIDPARKCGRPSV